MITSCYATCLSIGCFWSLPELANSIQFVNKWPWKKLTISLLLNDHMHWMLLMRWVTAKNPSLTASTSVLPSRSEHLLKAAKWQRQRFTRVNKSNQMKQNERCEFTKTSSMQGISLSPIFFRVDWTFLSSDTGSLLKIFLLRRTDPWQTPYTNQVYGRPTYTFLRTFTPLNRR